MQWLSCGIVPLKIVVLQHKKKQTKDFQFGLLKLFPESEGWRNSPETVYWELNLGPPPFPPFSTPSLPPGNKIHRPPLLYIFDIQYCTVYNWLSRVGWNYNQGAVGWNDFKNQGCAKWAILLIVTEYFIYLLKNNFKVTSLPWSGNF